MSRFRRILHPSDFSRASGGAFAKAVEVAKDNRAELLLVHVYTLPLQMMGEAYIPAATYAAIEASTRAGAKKARQADREGQAGRRARPSLGREGDPARPHHTRRALEPHGPDRDRHARAHRTRQDVPGQRGRARPVDRDLPGHHRAGKVAADHVASGEAVAEPGPVPWHGRGAEQRVLDIVGGLVHELGGPPARGAIRLDDALDRDLGIGSLERVELLLRIEKDFGVRLSDRVMEEASSPRDLVAAVIAAEPDAPKAPGSSPSIGAGRGRPRVGGDAPRCAAVACDGPPGASACRACRGAGPVDHLWRAVAARPAGGGGAPGAPRGARRPCRSDAPHGAGILRRLCRRPARGRRPGAHLSAVPPRSHRGVCAASGRHPRQRRGAGPRHVSRGRAGGRPLALPRALAAPCHHRGHARPGARSGGATTPATATMPR